MKSLIRVVKSPVLHAIATIDKKNGTWCLMEKRSGIILDWGRIAMPEWFRLT